VNLKKAGQGKPLPDGFPRRNALVRFGLKARKIIAQGERCEASAALGKNPMNHRPEGATEFSIPPISTFLKCRIIS